MTLTDEDKALIKSWDYAESDWMIDLQKWIDNGFKFTFSYDDYNHCFQCIGQRTDKDHEDYGILLGGRGSSPTKSFKQWIYIQSRLIGDSSWSENLLPNRRLEIDD